MTLNCELKIPNEKGHGVYMVFKHKANSGCFPVMFPQRNLIDSFARSQWKHLSSFSSSHPWLMNYEMQMSTENIFFILWCFATFHKNIFIIVRYHRLQVSFYSQNQETQPLLGRSETVLIETEYRCMRMKLPYIMEWFYFRLGNESKKYTLKPNNTINLYQIHHLYATYWHILN